MSRPKRSLTPLVWVLLALAVVVGGCEPPWTRRTSRLPTPRPVEKAREQTPRPDETISEPINKDTKPETQAETKDREPPRAAEVITLEARLQELKDDLRRSGYASLEDRVDLDLFPYRRLDEKLRDLTGMDFSTKALPRLKIRLPATDGAGASDQVAALYRRKENTIYFDPTILAEREKEATYHEFFHSKGYFEERTLNEGFVEYLTVLTTGLPPARYGIRAFNVHNLAFIVGLAAPERDPGESEAEEQEPALPTEDILRRGRALLARAFYQGSLRPIIALLNRHRVQLGNRLLVDPYRPRDELGFVRAAIAAEDFLQSRGYELQEYPQTEITLDNFGFINFSRELWVRAISLYSQVLQRRPNSRLTPHLKVALGNLHVKTGSYQEAATAYEEVLQSAVGPRFPVAVVQLSLSNCYEKLGEWKKALAALKKVTLSTQPFLRAKAHFLRAGIYAQKREVRKALTEFRFVRSQRVTVDTQSYMANSYLEAGKLLLEEKSYRPALKELVAGVQRFPDSVTAVESRLKMGETYEKLRLFHKAREIYLWLVRERPRFHWANQARFNLGKLYLTVYQDRWTALQYFREVIRHAPLSPEAEESREICRQIAVQGAEPAASSSVPSG